MPSVKLSKLIIVALVTALLIPAVHAAEVETGIEVQLQENAEIPVIVKLKDDEATMVKANVALGNKEYATQTLDRVKKAVREKQEKVISSLKSSPKKPSARALARAESQEGFELKLKRQYSIINSFSGNITSEGLEKLRANPDVEKIYYDWPVKSSLDYSANHINASLAWPIQYNGTNITGIGETVCIIDTGIQYTHPDLGGCLGAGCRVLGGYDYINNDNDPMDDNGHGTHVAGIVASTHAAYKGIAPGANLIAMKALNSGGSGSTDNVVASIDWCTENSALYNISVISMSLSLTDGEGNEYIFTSSCDGNDGVADAANAAANAGIFVAAAAGNSGNLTGIASPACASNVTGVGAVNDANVMSYNRGPILDLLAPGVSITSTYPTDTFAIGSGTSMATPHVAGAAALLLQMMRLENKSNMSIFQVHNVLNETGIAIDDSGSSGSTFRLINVYNAIAQLDEHAPDIAFIYPTPANNTVTKNNSMIAINISAQETPDTIYIDWNGTNYSMTRNSMTYYWINYSLAKGNYTYKVYANDSFGNSMASGTYYYEVNNSPPNITGSYPLNAVFSIIEPNNQTFNVSYTNNESETVNVTWYQNGTKAGSGISYTFQGAYDSAGIYNITAEVSDGFYTAIKNWTMTVNNTNSEPDTKQVILNSSAAGNKTTENLTCYARAEDDNTTLVGYYNWYNGTSLVLHENITAYNNTFLMATLSSALTRRNESWKCGVFFGDNGLNESDMNNATITIANTAPIFDFDLENHNISSGQKFEYDINCSDSADGDSITYSDNSSSFDITSAGLINWSTSSANHGLHWIEIKCSDSEETTQAFSINVTGDDGSAPTIAVSAPSNTETFIKSYKIDFNWTTNKESNCSYSVDNADKTYFPAFAASFTKNLSIYENSLHNITINCSDRYNNSNKTTVDFTVSDLSAPVLSSPSPSGTQTSSDVTISVITDEPSTCKTDSANNSFENMTYTMTKNSDTSYSFNAAGLANGDYTYYVQCNDTIGNKHTTSLMINFSVSVTTAAVTSNNAGGGGGGGGGLAFSEEKAAAVQSGGNAFLEYSEYKKLGVSGIMLSAKNEIKNARIKVKISAKPYSAKIPISSEDGRVFKYLNIIGTSLNDDDLNNATISFKIPVSWFNNTNLSTRHVRMLRLVNDSWTNLTTNLASFGKEYNTYDSVTPGFSSFSIIAEMIKPGEAAETIADIHNNNTDEIIGESEVSGQEFMPTNSSEPQTATGKSRLEDWLWMPPWISAIAVVLVLMAIIATAMIIRSVGKK